jgi:hypothetical protein
MEDSAKGENAAERMPGFELVCKIIRVEKC